MRASLITGIDTAKGLAVAWQVPLLGVNHMQAHALTPRLVSAIEAKSAGIEAAAPAFPYLTLLVSGGHTMLVHSRDLCNHQIYADTVDIAIGDMLDKCARDILPEHVLDSAGGVSYGPVLEKFAFPEGSPHYPEPSSMEEPESNTSATPSWSITPPLLNPAQEGSMQWQACSPFRDRQYSEAYHEAKPHHGRCRATTFGPRNHAYSL